MSDNYWYPYFHEDNSTTYNGNVTINYNCCHQQTPSGSQHSGGPGPPPGGPDQGYGGVGQGHGQAGQGHGGPGHNPGGPGQNPSGFGHNPGGFGNDPGMFGHNPRGFGHNPGGFGHNPGGPGHDSFRFGQGHGGAGLNRGWPGKHPGGPFWPFRRGNPHHYEETAHEQQRMFPAPPKNTQINEASMVNIHQKHTNEHIADDKEFKMKIAVSALDTVDFEKYRLKNLDGSKQELNQLLKSKMDVELPEQINKLRIGQDEPESKPDEGALARKPCLSTESNPPEDETYLKLRGCQSPIETEESNPSPIDQPDIPAMRLQDSSACIFDAHDMLPSLVSLATGAEGLVEHDHLPSKTVSCIYCLNTIKKTHYQCQRTIFFS